MFQSLYRIQQHPDRQFGEAVLNYKGVIVMLLLFFLETPLAIAVDTLLYYLNLYLGTNFDSISMNWFYDLSMLALLIFFFGRFYWENLKSFFVDFKLTYLGIPVLCYVLAQFGGYVVQIILYMIRGTSEQTSNNELVMDYLGQKPIPLIIMAVFLAPVIEESIFRAGMCRPLTVKKNYFVKALGFTLSSFVFAFMHVYQYAFEIVTDEVTGAMSLAFNADEFLSILVYLPMAFGFAACSYFCKNFWGSVIGHFITNGIAMALMLLLSTLS